MLRFQHFRNYALSLPKKRKKNDRMTDKALTKEGGNKGMTKQKQRQVVNIIIQYLTCGKHNIEEEHGGPDNCLEFLLP